MSFLNRWRAMRVFGVGLMMAAALAVTGPASAQFGEAAGIAESMQPDYFRRDVVIISQGLKLDETQRIIVNTLFEDYESAFEEGLTRMKSRFDGMRDKLQASTQKEILKTVFGQFRDWNVERRAIGDQFMANIEVVLTEDQLQQLPAVRRRLYRERTLHKGRLSGESLNLFDIVRDMHLDHRTSLQVQPILEAYDIALDRALHNREDPLVGKDNPMLQSLEDQDPAMGQAALRKHIANQIAVRQVNDQYIEQIASVLTDDLAAKFRLSAYDRAYPRIFRETPVERMFKVARELEGLDSQVRQAVIELEREFLAELTVKNQNLLSALREYEPIEAQERAADFAKRMAGQQIEPKIDPTRKLFAEREELSRAYATRLKALLTEDQFALLPGGYRWVDVPVVQPPPDIRRANDKMMKEKGEKGELGFSTDGKPGSFDTPGRAETPE